MSSTSTMTSLNSKLKSSLSSFIGIPIKGDGAVKHRNIAVVKPLRAVGNLPDDEFIKSVDLFHCVQTSNIASVERYFRIKGNTALYLRKYGALGPTLIQWAYLYKQFEMGRLLISYSPERVLDTVNSPFFFGENVLHMAIIHGRMDEVKYLCTLTIMDSSNIAQNLDLHDNIAIEPVKSKVDDANVSNKKTMEVKKLHLGKLLVGQVASGEFFKRGTAYYFGEFPLFFAVATNQIEMVSMILDTCFPTPKLKLLALLQCNSHGDNLLHICVYRNLTECYEYLVKTSMALAKVTFHDGNVSVFNENLSYHLLFKTFGNCINIDGKSPLTLAAELGYTDMFECIMSIWRLAQWSYGPVNKHLYNIIGLDFQYPCEYYEHIQFDTSTKPTKAASIGIRESMFKAVSKQMLLTKQTWESYFEQLEGIHDVAEEAKDVKCNNNGEECGACVDNRARQFYVPTAISVIAENKRYALINNTCLKQYILQKWKHWGTNLLRKKLGWTALTFCVFLGFVISRSAYMLAENGSKSEAVSTRIALAFYVLLLILELKNMWIEMCLFRIYTCSRSNYYSKMHGSARAYTFVIICFQFSILAGAIATAYGHVLAENICFAASSFLSTCSLLWCLLGDESIGKLIMSIIEIISSDLYSYAVVYTVAISGFTAAFYLLSPMISLSAYETNAYEYNSQPILLYLQRYGEMLFNGFNPGAPSYASYILPNVQWYAEILCFLFLFCIPTLMLNLLIAIMNDRYSTVQKSVTTRWLLEMCNIMRRFEMEIIALNEIHNVSSSNSSVKFAALARIEVLVDEFKQFIVTVGSDHTNKYIEIESITHDWNKKPTLSNPSENDTEDMDEDEFEDGSMENKSSTSNTQKQPSGQQVQKQAWNGSAASPTSNAIPVGDANAGHSKSPAAKYQTLEEVSDVITKLMDV